jgi:hypothetical protein
MQWDRRLYALLAVAAIGVVFCGLSSWRVSASDPPVAAEPKSGGDWPMWGGSPDRNMVSGHKGLPTTWDVEKKVNVKWVSTLGSQSYGNRWWDGAGRNQQ